MLPVLGICCCPASQGQQAPGQHKTYKKQIRKRIALVDTQCGANARAELVRRLTTKGGATRAQRLKQPVESCETRREAGARLRASRMSSRPGTCKRQTRSGSGSTRASPFSLALGLHHCLPPLNVPPCLHGFASMGLPPSYRSLACHIKLLVCTPPRLSRAQKGRASAQTTRASEEMNAVGMGRGVDSEHRAKSV